MSTTCQNLFDGAIDRSTANRSDLFSGKDAEILRRVNRSQQRLFTKLAQENRYFYVQAAVLPSTNAASARTADLASFANPPLERLLVAKLPSGTELSQVDLQDLEAELVPRFYPLGTQMVEVGNDWGAAGVVNLSVWYASRPVELDLAGALSQVITIPDRFADYLEIDLAIYMAGKDYGRAAADPQELPRLTDERDRAYADFTQMLDHFPGPSARRFVLPTPTAQEKA